MPYGEVKSHDELLCLSTGSRTMGAEPPILSGKDTVGEPLEGHQHAFHLLTDEDGDRRLDHLTVWVPAGWDSKALRAIVAMKELAHPRGQGDRIQLAYQAGGIEDDFVDVSPLFDRSRRWRSLSPYVLPRHRKRTSDGPEEQITREIALRWPDRRVSVKIQDPQCPLRPCNRGARTGFDPLITIGSDSGAPLAAGRSTSS